MNMRHLFYVQSNLSCLVCQAIVVQRRLLSADTLFILDRGTEPPRGFPSITAPHRLRSPLRDSFRSILENRRVRADLQTHFTRYSEGDTFEIYVNRMNYLFLEIAEAHHAWRATHIYEEGLAAYYRKIGSDSVHNDSSLLTRLRNRVIKGMSGYELFKPRQTFYTAEYNRAFATCSRAFIRFPRREIVNLQGIIAEHSYNQADSDLLRNSLVFVMPLHNAFSSDPSSAERLLNVLSDVIKAFPDRPVVFKPHPDFFTDNTFWEKFYFDLGKLVGLNITNFRHDLQLEKIALSRKDILFCVVISSLGAYAQVFGAKIISVAPVALGSDHPLVKEFQTLSPGVLFWDRLGERPNGFDVSKLLSEELK
jgi:hypothetical protein